MKRKTVLKYLGYAALLTSMGGVATLSHYVSGTGSATGQASIDPFVVTSSITDNSTSTGDNFCIFDDANNTIHVWMRPNSSGLYDRSNMFKATITNGSVVPIDINFSANENISQPTSFSLVGTDDEGRKSGFKNLNVNSNSSKITLEAIQTGN
jgi:hypothetical protein